MVEYGIKRAGCLGGSYCTLTDKLRKQLKLNAVFKDIERELQAEETRRSHLEAMVTREGRDVEKLEGLSLAGLFYTILGSKEQQLNKERQEYLAAKLKYDECLEAIAFLQKDRADVQTELAQLSGTEEQYRQILLEKEKLLLEKGDRNTGRIMALAEEIASLQSDGRELREAIDAGNAVLQENKNLLEHLGSARRWGTWDMLGGGILSTAIKHSRLNEAKSSVQRIQQLLRTFHRELDDIDPALKASIDIEIGSFLTFADYFFDGLIVDWIVQSRIVNSLDRAINLKSEMLTIVSRLQAEHDRVQNNIQDKIKERKGLIETT